MDLKTIQYPIVVCIDVELAASALARCDLVHIVRATVRRVAHAVAIAVVWVVVGAGIAGIADAIAIIIRLIGVSRIGAVVALCACWRSTSASRTAPRSQTNPGQPKWPRRRTPR